MDYQAIRDRDFFYSAIMLNSDITFKNINELTTRKVIRNYRDLYNLELLKSIANGDYDLNNQIVTRIKKLIDSYPDICKIAKGYKSIASSNNIQVVSIEDNYYPYNWKIQCGMPKVFYFRGNYNILERMKLGGSAAVVGSRNPSNYAKYATEEICKALGDRGITIVSGMAYGIDRAAHMSSHTTLGSTVAVLAGGVDNIYPPANKDVYEALVQNGIIVSEMPPGQRPLRQYFPSRNRLIGGLSDCTLVMEAGTVSGTLHTASFAANQGKEIFVLPNSIYYENCLGGLKLLEDGANVLLNVDNVVDSISHALMFKRMALGYKEDVVFDDFEKEEISDHLSIDMIREIAKVRPEALDDEQWKCLIKDAITLKPLCIDELCVITMLPFYKVSKLLTELELSGTVCQEKGKYSLTFV